LHTPLILLVEDEPGALRAMTVIFRHRGWAVAQAATLSEAVAQLDREPDFVVLDLMLPDGSGEDLLERVRERGHRCRVVVATACDDQRRLKALHGLGATAVLCKPLDIDEVCRYCEA
jgi:DNA-binding response OmpR family regulator